MYPKVKVRDEAQDVDEDDYTTRFYKALDALSLHKFPSPPGDLFINLFFVLVSSFRFYDSFICSCLVFVQSAVAIRCLCF